MKFSPKITSPALESFNLQDGNMGLQLQVPRGGTNPNGVGSELTQIFFLLESLFFCYSWFRLQLIAIHCNRRSTTCDVLSTLRFPHVETAFQTVSNFNFSDYLRAQQFFSTARVLMRAQSYTWLQVDECRVVGTLWTQDFFFAARCFGAVHRLPQAGCRKTAAAKGRTLSSGFL